MNPDGATTVGSQLITEIVEARRTNDMPVNLAPQPEWFAEQGWQVSTGEPTIIEGVSYQTYMLTKGSDIVTILTPPEDRQTELEAIFAHNTSEEVAAYPVGTYVAEVLRQHVEPMFA